MKLKSTFHHSLRLGFFNSVRRISISAFPVLNKDGKAVSTILKGESDIDLTKENIDDYRKRSIRLLVENTYKVFESNPFILLKINQTVIDHEEWSFSRLKVKFIGHVWSGIFIADLANATLEPLPGSLLSKTVSETSHFFEDDQAILTGQLITSEYKNIRAKMNGSQEYYWGISPWALNFNIDTYTNRVANLKLDNKPYDLNLSSCGHAVYESFVGKRLSINKSPQSASVKSIFDIIKYDDKVIIDNLRFALFRSNLSDTADQVDKKFRASNSTLSQ